MNMPTRLMTLTGLILISLSSSSPAIRAGELSESEGTLQSSQYSFIVKPYLQIGAAPAAGSLQLLWHAANSEGDWSVEFRTATDEHWKNVEGLTSRTVTARSIEPHRVFSAT